MRISVASPNSSIILLLPFLLWLIPLFNCSSSNGHDKFQQQQQQQQKKNSAQLNRSVGVFASQASSTQKRNPLASSACFSSSATANSLLSHAQLLRYAYIGCGDARLPKTHPAQPNPSQQQQQQGQVQYKQFIKLPMLSKSYIPFSQAAKPKLLGRQLFFGRPQGQDEMEDFEISAAAAVDSADEDHHGLEQPDDGMTIRPSRFIITYDDSHRINKQNVQPSVGQHVQQTQNVARDAGQNTREPKETPDELAKKRHEELLDFYHQAKALFPDLMAKMLRTTGPNRPARSLDLRMLLWEGILKEEPALLYLTNDFALFPVMPDLRLPRHGTPAASSKPQGFLSKCSPMRLFSGSSNKGSCIDSSTKGGIAGTVLKKHEITEQKRQRYVDIFRLWGRMLRLSLEHGVGLGVQLSDLCVQDLLDGNGRGQPEDKERIPYIQTNHRNNRSSSRGIRVNETVIVAENDSRQVHQQTQNVSKQNEKTFARIIPHGQQQQQMNTLSDEQYKTGTQVSHSTLQSKASRPLLSQQQQGNRGQATHGNVRKESALISSNRQGQLQNIQANINRIDQVQQQLLLLGPHSTDIRKPNIYLDEDSSSMIKESSQKESSQTRQNPKGSAAVNQNHLNQHHLTMKRHTSG